ncbi:MAG: DNA mismatch repair protein MutS [Verrucomicrobiales bacterium]|nr:DNA mismatch repair protein MutS [Verrucomicrobiales bacterium]
MLKQYTSIRKSLPDDALLFFRLGDFYELFMEDAKEAAGLLGVALTKRNGMSMCGVPHHAAESYIGKLVKAGKRVAIAEQVGEVKPGKIVKREVTQIISAGTVNDLNLLDQKRNNFLAGIYFNNRRFGLAALDLTTGHFRIAEFTVIEELEDELSRLSPSELIYSDEQKEKFEHINANAIAYESYSFLKDEAEEVLLEHFGTHSLDGFGCSEMVSGVSAAGGVYHYVTMTLRRNVNHIRSLSVYQPNAHVLIDASSARNLDLVEHRAGRQHTLLGAMDRTKTPMGARKLRTWILNPLRDADIITSRHDLIESLVSAPFQLSKIRDSLSEVRDIERTVGRLSSGSGNARDLQALAKSILAIPEAKDHLTALEGGSLASALIKRMREFKELVELLENAIADEPPATLKDGGMFRDGYHIQLDELRAASTEGKQWIAQLQNEEAERTGIKSLKVKYNNVFGYFIEITKANLSNVPDDYTRKQTTANAERFITPALKEVENKILGADERAKQLEYEEFLKVREKTLESLDELQDTADALAEIDVLVSLAETARLFAYCRPVINNGKKLKIEGGRHPVLDQSTVDEKFVPNDAELNADSTRLIILTGPNMAGKSTYIRQVALLTLMAQIGSFVPAKSAEIGLVDRIFTRVGASDDLARGQSTFMVEMNETALILNNATESSLVILDEIGRGTATFDGLSIAWAVAEHLNDKIGCRTLFATHYHELTALSESRAGVGNANVAVREHNDKIIFLRKIVEGSADRSYGIQVARLAGLPPEIIKRSKSILAHLEKTSARPEEEKNTNRPAKKSAKKKAPKKLPESQAPQLNLFN